MANKIEFVVLGDVKDLEKKLSSAEKGFTALSKGAGLALAGLTATTLGFLNAAKEQEQAVNQLNQALRNQGTYSEEASRDLLKYADTLQNVSLFTDEAIIKSQAILATLGFNADVTNRLTKATADLAQAQGIDLASAAQLVTRAIGNSGEVIRGTTIQLEGVAGSTQKAESAILALNKTFGGQAKAATEGIGQIDLLKKSVGELGEDIGTLLAPKVLSVTADIKKFIDFVKQHPELTKMASEAIFLGIQLSAVGLAIGLIGKISASATIAMTALSGTMATLSTLGVLGLTTNIGLLITKVGILYPAILALSALLLGLKIGEGILAYIKALNKELDELDAKKFLGSDYISEEDFNKKKEQWSKRKALIDEESKAIAEAQVFQQERKAETSDYIKGIDEELKQLSQAKNQQEVADLIEKFNLEREALISHLTIKQEIMANNGVIDVAQKELVESQIRDINNKYDALEFEAQNAQQNKINFFEQKGLDLYKKVQNDKLGTLMSTLQQAAGLNKEFAIAYQVLAIGEAAMNTALGITAALSHLDFASAALVALQGGIQIATIASQSFAVGTPNVPYDMTAQIHKDEMIVPATFSEAIRSGDLSLSGGNGSGSGVTFDFTGATFNGITDKLVEDIFTKASENLFNGTLSFRSA